MSASHMSQKKPTNGSTISWRVTGFVLAKSSNTGQKARSNFVNATNIARWVVLK